MGRISTDIGLATGFPIASTVSQLIALAAQPRDALQKRTDQLQTVQNTFTELSTQLIKLQLTTLPFSTASAFDQRTATSSNPSALSVTTTGSPALGTYQFTPLQMAQAQQLLSSGFASQTEPLGTGSFAFRFGGFLDNGASLSQLNGGNSFVPGKIRVTDRSGATDTIDVSGARTVDDVINAFNRDTNINVRLETQNGAFVLVDNTGETTSNLKVQEVGSGTTAASLGLAGINVASGQAQGNNVVVLGPNLAIDALNNGHGVRFDAGLDDLQISFRDNSTPLKIGFETLGNPGTKATGATNAANGLNGQVLFTAAKAGSTYAGVRVSFVNDPNVTKGNETVAYDANAKTLVFKISAGNTTAGDIVKASNNDPAASAAFAASLPSGGDGTGKIDLGDVALTGGAIIDPVPARTVRTVGDVLNILNSADPTRLKAGLSADGQHIVLTDLTADNGGSFAVTAQNGSQAANDLGLTAAASGATITSGQLIGGLKTSLLTGLAGGAGLGPLGIVQLTDRSGATASVDLSAAQTIDDILAAINASGLGIQARVNGARNGVQLTDTTGQATSNLIVANGDATATADKLGWTANTASTSVDGGDLKLQIVNENTTLASLNGGAGVGKGSFKITAANGTNTTIDLAVSNINTIGDLITQINARGIGVTASINPNGDGIQLADTTGGNGTLRVQAVSGTAAADLRLLNAATTQTVGNQTQQVINASTTFKVDLAATDTLGDLVQRINALGAGVTAAVFNDGSSTNPYRLSLTSQHSGHAGALLVDGSKLSNTTFQTISNAQDAVVQLGSGGAGGTLAVSSTNTFTNILPGINLQVLGASASPVTVSVTNSTTGVANGIQRFVDTYNALRTSLMTDTAFNQTDPTNPTSGTNGPLFGDVNALQIESGLSNLLSGQFFVAGSIQSLGAVGITLQNDGTLSFDSAQLNAQLAQDPDAVQSLFTTKNVGVVDRVRQLVDRLAGGQNALLINRLGSLSQIIADNNQRLGDWQARLDRQSQRLTLQFQRMDQAIAQMQSNLQVVNSILNLFTNSGNGSSTSSSSNSSSSQLKTPTSIH